MARRSASRSLVTERVGRLLAATLCLALAAPASQVAAQGMHGRQGMGRGMGPMGGMMGPGSATPAERQDLHALLFQHQGLTRTVDLLPNGIRTLTQSDDPQLAEALRRHVADMVRRLDAGDDPGLPIESPTLRSLFPAGARIVTRYEPTASGVAVLQTSDDPAVAKALQTHAAEVSDLVDRGMAAAHETMMRNRHGAASAR